MPLCTTDRNHTQGNDMSAVPGLVYANFQLECDCGTVVPTSFIGMRDTTIILCPDCKSDLSLDPDEYEEMAEQFEDSVVALFHKAGLGQPSQELIRFIQLHNRVPADGELLEPKGYPVPLVGEQHYQDAIRHCSPGQPVTLYHEVGNPHDDDAIVAISAGGAKIGYVPRDSFVQEVVHDQGRGCAATILSVAPGSRGFDEVVLDVTVGGAAVELLPYRQ